MSEISSTLQNAIVARCPRGICGDPSGSSNNSPSSRPASTAEAEPEIYATTQRWGSVLENVVVDPDTGVPDFDDASLTENGRVTLSDNRLIVTDEEKRKEQVIKSVEQYRQTIGQYFEISLSEAEATRLFETGLRSQ